MIPLRKPAHLFPLLLACLPCLHAAEPEKYAGHTPIEWSQKMADSEMQRLGNTLHYQGSAKARWDYTSGFFAWSLVQLGKATNEKKYSDEGSAIVTSFLDENGYIQTYRKDDHNIDMILSGRVLLEVHSQQPSEKLKFAIETLRAQLVTQPRTSDGGFWHKQRYPWQMWLDGLYMGSPFLARYATTHQSSGEYEEVVEQITLMDMHAYDPETGLHHHGWDERREQSWADPETGVSPCFWGRSVGWYAMAVVDCLDDLPPTLEGTDKVQEIFQRIAKGIAARQDEKSGLWWQVLDQPRREGNYLESTCSAMFVYALAKGINRGYLDRATYMPVVEKGYQGLVSERIRTDENGHIHLTHCCEVAGLGFTSATGHPRDGSFAYYISEPVIEDDLKGVSPFILAGIEVQKLGAQQPPTTFSARGWQDLEQVLSFIKSPTFPEKSFPAELHEGKDATEAIRAAIKVCHEAGGGRVLIPEGDWHTGPLVLLSNVNLHLAKGATLKFSTNPDDYPVVLTRYEGMECMNYQPPIYATGAQNIAITGHGTLDGQADWDNWWSWIGKRKGQDNLGKPARTKLNDMVNQDVPTEQRVFGKGAFLRPNFIQFMRCKNILIEDVNIIRSPMWEIHPVLSENITVRNVSISSHGPNNDGCDPESCRNVLIEGCTFDTGDDCIAIKSGRNNDGRRFHTPSENIVVRHCTMKDGHGGVVMGSEISGGVRNVFVEDCTMDSENLDRALRFKSNAMRGGTIENVFMRNVEIGQVAEAILTIDFLYEEGANGQHPPTVRNVHMENITSQKSPRVIWARGYEGATIDDIFIKDSTFEGITESEILEHVGKVSFDHVTIRQKNLKPAKNSVPNP